MGTLFLHIGTPKTGTSTMQFFLRRNMKALKRVGFSYPEMEYRFEGVDPKRNAHFLLQKYFIGDTKQRDTAREEALFDEGMDKVVALFQEYENVVLSDESLWHAFFEKPGLYARIKKIINDAGHELHVIVYLRRQDSYIQSAWTQKLKTSYTKSFEWYVKHGKVDRNHFDYFESLEKIAEVVGQEHMTVRAFEPSRFKPYGPENKPSLAADFLDILGLELDDSYKEVETKRNTSIAGRYLAAKRILNEDVRFHGRKNFMTPLLLELTQENDVEKGYDRLATFPGWSPAEYLQQFAKTNEDTARNYLGREDGVLFYDMPKQQQYDEYTTEELVKACGDMVLRLHNDLVETQQKLAQAQAQIAMEPSNRVKRKLNHILHRDK